MKTRTLLLPSVLFLLALPGAASSQQFDVLDLTAICGMGTARMNDAGVVTGRSYQDEASRGLVFDQNGCHELPVHSIRPGFMSEPNILSPEGINNLGDIVGSANAARGTAGTDSAHVYSAPIALQNYSAEGARSRQIHLRGTGVEGIARAINDNGMVVGHLSEPTINDDFRQPFAAFRGGSIRLLRMPQGSVGGEVSSTNNRNEAVGTTGSLFRRDGLTMLGVKPTIWRRSSVERLTLPEGHTFGEALDINSQSVVVGYARDGLADQSNRVVPVLWDESGQVRELSSMPGLYQFDGNNQGMSSAINDCGFVVGRTAGEGAVIWTPEGQRFALSILSFRGPLHSALDINNQGQILVTTGSSVLLLNPRPGSMFAESCESFTAIYPSYPPLTEAPPKKNYKKKITKKKSAQQQNKKTKRTRR